MATEIDGMTKPADAAAAPPAAAALPLAAPMRVTIGASIDTRYDDVIAHINVGPARVLAVDVPSGLDANTGEPLGPCARAHHTVTFVAPKVGFHNPAAALHLGHVHVADVGITPRHVPV
jgi:NAD(P)H-hydrate epimerase